MMMNLARYMNITWSRQILVPLPPKNKKYFKFKNGQQLIFHATILMPQLLECANGLHDFVRETSQIKTHFGFDILQVSSLSILNM